MSLLRRHLKQTAVYWPSPTPDGWGGYTLGTPQEISVRWEHRQELFIDAQGNEVRCSSVVYADQDLELGGYLYLGVEDSLDSNHDDPTAIEGTLEIRGYSKSPSLSGRQYVRKVWL